MNLFSFLHRRHRERLADEAAREQGRREGREFIENWRRFRSLGWNVPEGGLLPPRPTVLPPPPPKSPPRRVSIQRNENFNRNPTQARPTPPPPPPKPQGAPPQIVVLVVRSSSK